MPTEKKITYLLGAGASYNALPLVNEIPHDLDNMLHYIKTYHNENYKKGHKYDFNNTERIISYVKEHYSIDTLAKKYWLMSEYDDFKRVKSIIACLMIFRNVHLEDIRSSSGGFLTKTSYEIKSLKNRDYQHIDNRYDAFLAAILNKVSTSDNVSLPQNLNIVSWNYDFQLELSLDFFVRSSVESLFQKFNWICENNVKQFNINESGLIKLNGTGLIYDNDLPQKYYYEYDEALHELFLSALGNTPKGDLFNLVKFAWEKSIDAMSVRNIASEIIKKSNVIVVIGYSFPVFNREVDIDIFKEFDGKIYIQDRADRVEQIKNQLESIKLGLSKKCEVQTNIEQFLIPNEYWVEPPRRGYQTLTI